MTTPNNGGAAFPSSNAVEVGDCRTNGHPGMDLRDYFAAKALQGLMASRSANSPTFHPKDDAEYVYAVADAMLAARGAP